MTKQELQLKYDKLVKELVIVNYNYTDLNNALIKAEKQINNKDIIETLNLKILNNINTDIEQKSKIKELEELFYELEKNFISKVSQIQQDYNISVTHLQSKINKIPKWVFNIWN